jgi:hypothetical protein
MFLILNALMTIGIKYLLIYLQIIYICSVHCVALFFFLIEFVFFVFISFCKAILLPLLKYISLFSVDTVLVPCWKHLTVFGSVSVLLFYSFVCLFVFLSQHSIQGPVNIQILYEWREVTIQWGREKGSIIFAGPFLGKLGGGESFCFCGAGQALYHW